MQPLAIDPNLVDDGIVVQDFLSHNVWDIHMLKACLLTHVIDRIAVIFVSCSSAAADRMIWKSSPNGQFSVRSAYTMVKDSNSLPQCFLEMHMVFSYSS